MTANSTAPTASAAADKWLRTDHISANLRRRSASGGAVTVSSQAVKFVLSMISAAIMARLLSPTDFGLVAMSLGAFNFLHIFKEAGLSTATVQRQDISMVQVSNLFWINLGVSGVISVLVMAMSPLIAWFFHDSRLVGLTCALSLTFVLNGAAVQHLALLNRQMEFRAIAFIEIASIAGSIVVGVALAWLNFGPWALIGNQLSVDLFALLLTLRAAPWCPNWPKRRAGTGSLVRFGAHLTAGDFFLSLMRGLDTTLIGRVYGTAAVGLYSRAYALLMRPLYQIVTPVSSVLLPALATLQSHAERYRRSYLRAFDFIAVGTFFVTGMLLALAHPVTLVLLGPKWEAAARIFAGFMLAALYIPFAMASRWLYTTQGRGAEFLKTNFVVSLVTASAFVAGLPFGPFGVAVATSISGCFVRLPILFYSSGRHGPVTTTDQWRGFFRHLPLWLVVVGGSYLGPVLMRHYSDLLQLLVGATTGTVCGAVFIWSYAPQRRVVLDLFRLVAELRRGGDRHGLTGQAV